MTALGAFVLRHYRVRRVVGRVIGRDRMSRLVWGALDAMPGFRESLERGLQEAKEHRTYRLSPNLRMQMAHPDWPLDGEQPKSPRGVWVAR